MASGLGPTDIVSVGPIEIDQGAHRVRVHGQGGGAHAHQYRLLMLLYADVVGESEARAHLLETVWEAAPDIQTRTVDMHVQRLRAKLSDAGDLIETVRGFGYRLRNPGVRAS